MKQEKRKEKNNAWYLQLMLHVREDKLNPPSGQEWKHELLLLML